jgi:beta-N-acetylhexosaminidase
MDLRDKLGQRFVYRLPDTTVLSSEIADFLVECRAGGVVLFGYNIQTPQQVARLNRDLQDLAVRASLPPFMVALDEEGGQVSRMPGEGQDLITPSQMAQAIGGPQMVRDCAEVTARRLRGLGFNLNFTPVLDINNNPANPVIGTRSFGEEPQKVAEFGAIAIEAYLENRLSPCVKHFPGHGDTSVDSHFGLPVVNKSLQELEKFELVPFYRAIEAGVPGVMTAHICYPQVETSGLPGTFSPVFLTKILRQQLGFDGLIFTDALDMGAIRQRYGLGKACKLSFEAGVDVVLSLSMSLDEQRAAFEEIVVAAERGEIDLAAWDESLARIEKWKARFCLPPHDFEPPASDYELVAQSARRGITVSNAKKKLLPLTQVGAKKPLLVDFMARIESPVEEGRLPGPLLEECLRPKLPGLTHLEIPADPDESAARQVLQHAAQTDLLIIVTRNAMRYESQAQLVRELVAGSYDAAPAVVIAAREPYDLALFEAAPVTIATYGDPPATIKALARLLTEE